MKILIALLICAGLAHAALPATAVWEIRSTATAGNVNGGGFNSARGGTDYTLQDAAQLTGTDGASVTTSTTFTSASVTFTSVMVGNYIHITTTGTGAQCVVGWYEVVTYTDANNVVLDRAPSAGTGCVAATWYLGGAALIGSALDDDMFEAAVPGNIFYIKAGSYTLGETVSVAADGTATGRVSIIGYNSTRGDNPTGSTRPSFAANTTNSLSITGDYWFVGYLIFNSSAATAISLGPESIMISCKVTNNSTTAGRVAIQPSNTGDTTIVNSEFISYRGVAVTSTARVHYVGVYVHDSDIGFNFAAAGSAGTITDSIIADNVTAAINTATTAVTQQVIVQNCTLYGRADVGGTGINLITGVSGFRLINSIVYGFVTGVTHADSTNDGFEVYSAFYNNTTNRTNWAAGVGAVTTDPAFAGVGQLTGATATTSGSVLTQGGGDFSTVTDNVDFLYLVSGTGVTAGKYLITSHTADTVTLDIAPGTNATADKVWKITTGHNFAVGANMKALAYPGAFPGASTTSYLDIGAVQRVEPAASASGGSYIHAQ